MDPNGNDLRIGEDGPAEPEGAGTAAGPATPDRKRYRLSDSPDGVRVLCHNSPNISLHYRKGHTESGPLRRNTPRGSIFLDGAYAGPPFYDNKRGHYSLDHHAGCVRSFTLATCEQAAVVIFQGMPLAEGTWTILINAVDADSIIAAWLLMNHAELLKDRFRLLEKAMPFVRLEGAIDAHGLEAGVLSGVDAGLRASLEKELADLSGKCATISRLDTADAGEGLVEILTMIDGLVLPDESIEELLAFEELGRVALRGGGMAIIARSDSGLYETEAFFKSRLGKSLDLLILSQAEGQYSVRLVNRFRRDDLGRLFAYLNKRDKAVLQAEDRKGNCWGGSANIGGSPRKTGSALSPPELLEAVERVYGLGSSFLGRLRSLLRG